MSTQATEADARILVDDLLREALWDPADKSQVLTEVHIQNAKKNGRREKSNFGNCIWIRIRPR